jgi:hypothetical protein
MDFEEMKSLFQMLMGNAALDAMVKLSYAAAGSFIPSHSQ